MAPPKINKKESGMWKNQRKNIPYIAYRLFLRPYSSQIRNFYEITEMFYMIIIYTWYIADNKILLNAAVLQQNNIKRGV